MSSLWAGSAPHALSLGPGRPGFGVFSPQVSNLGREGPPKTPNPGKYQIRGRRGPKHINSGTAGPRWPQNLRKMHMSVMLRGFWGHVGPDSAQNLRNIEPCSPNTRFCDRFGAKFGPSMARNARNTLATWPSFTLPMAKLCMLHRRQGHFSANAGAQGRNWAQTHRRMKSLVIV